MALKTSLSTALKSFQQSNAKFRVLKTIQPSYLKPQDPIKLQQKDAPKTLFILDSSFNPPSTAHLALAQSVLKDSIISKHAGPHRLLLLFSTSNADKAPSPASFDHRLAMMTVFSQDLLSSIPPNHTPVPIDIGVTTAPYYTDKSAAIESVDGQEWYSSEHVHHVHLIGYDTLIRFFGAKYYAEKFDPPFSALNPFFDAGHRLRVTLRPQDSEGGSVEEQKAFVKRLEDGEMEADGGEREWAKQVELVEPTPEAGISSTKIREAAKVGDVKTEERLCTPSVAEWVQREGLYTEESSEAKKSRLG